MTTLPAAELAGAGRQSTYYMHEPPLPHSIQWPPFVIDYPRQIDFPLVHLHIPILWNLNLTIIFSTL